MFSGVGTAKSLLTGFYEYPGQFMSGINQVISIKENGISILATVLVVAMILFIAFNWSEYHK